MMSEQKKQARGTTKGAVTRIINNIDQLLQRPDNQAEVKIQAGLLQDAHDAFTNAHMEYVAELTDETDKTDADAYLASVQDKVNNVNSRIQHYVRGEKDKDTPKQEDNAMSGKRAALLKKQELLRKKHELDEQEQRIKREKEMLLLELELEQLKSDSDDDADTVIIQPRPTTSTPAIRRHAEPSEPTANESAASVLSSQGLQEEQLRQQKQLIEILQAPKAELPIFDGDPLKYYVFIRSFENSVERVVDNDTAKLTRLMQFCRGKALSLLQCCTFMEPAAGYAKAKELLKERYGNNCAISKAWIDKVTQGQVIKPNANGPIREYADDLRNCYETLKAMDRECLTEINASSNLLRLVERLPSYLKNRWKKEVRDIRKFKERNPVFEDVVKFVEEAAEEANDPVYGNMTVERRPTRQHSATFVTGITDKQKCFVCDSYHSVFSCNAFREMSVNDRSNVVQRARLCFNCLKPGHSARFCRSGLRCSVQGCGLRHHKFLHRTVGSVHVQGVTQGASTDGAGSRTQPTTGGVTNQAGRDQNGAGSRGAAAVNHCATESTRVVLPVVPIKVWPGESQQPIVTYALLDTGSTHTFCTEALMQAAGIVGEQRVITRTTLDSTKAEIKTRVAAMRISDVDENEFLELPSVYTTSAIAVSSGNTVKGGDLQQWSHLRDLPVSQIGATEVTVLIGQDNADLLAQLEVRRGPPGAPIATKTRLGWCVHGPVKYEQQNAANYKATCYEACTLDVQLEKFWKIESVGAEDKAMSREDLQAMQQWEATITRKDGHYEMGIPFKKEQPHLPNNVSAARQRLASLKKRLQSDSELQKKYKENMADMINKGFAVRVSDDEESPMGKTWYLPHHPVMHPQRPGKVRIVFDCAAKFSGTSLNDNILQGPDLTNKLLGVLMRFRTEKVAIMGDIEAMFHQVRVTPEDRDVLRFLWWPNGDMEAEPVTYKMCVHLFGGTWSPSCCTYAVRRTVEESGSKYDEEISRAVLRNLYVDDCLKSLESVDAAVRTVSGMKGLLGEGGFNLTKWTSNNKDVLEQIPEADRSKNAKDLNLCALPAERALGVYWNVESDMFSYKVNEKTKPLTKRGVLSVASSVYDPLGFIGPFILKAKQILQELTRKRVEWDDALPDEDIEQWNKWKADLQDIEKIEVPRCLQPEHFGKVINAQLHHFSDASQTAYGVASYVRLVDENNQVHCSLLMAKSRVAPIKQLTIPRLELAAAAMAAEQDALCRGELEAEPIAKSMKSYFWTDSKIVLQYLNNGTKRFHTFVANRVDKILGITTPAQWRHVPTKENPADDASRGQWAEELRENKRWWSGPKFLSKEENEWPQQANPGEVADNDTEVKKCFAAEKADKIHEEHPIDLVNRHSDWNKLKKAVAHILLVKDILLKHEPRGAQVTAAHMDRAENAILKRVQQQHLTADTIRKMQNLNPVEKNELWCVGGRLKNAEVPAEMKYPVILPRDSHVVDLIIRKLHEESGHSGREYVLGKTREKYWIISGRVAVRRCLNNCGFCKRNYAKPQQPQMANLPEDRVSPGEAPFTRVGVDYFGPFFVKRGRGREKRYGCIFTCLTMRAVHIEVAHSLDTDSFLNALQRFISRRGKPKLIRSDNGTNFVGAEKELREVLRTWDNKKINGVMNNSSIEWKFNTPNASHAGGVWERQIRTIRRILTGLTKEQILTDESLLTLMCTVENIINGRPLTTVSDDPTDENPLTPNHLLTMKGGVIPPGVFNATDINSRKRWKQVQYLADVFWRRWLKDYLPTLQRRSKWQKTTRNMKVGDVVVVCDYTLPRNVWKLGRVVEVMAGNDGAVRSVKIRTAKSEYVRSVRKVCLVEGVC